MGCQTPSLSSEACLVHRVCVLPLLEASGAISTSPTARPPTIGVCLPGLGEESAPLVGARDPVEAENARDAAPARVAFGNARRRPWHSSSAVPTNGAGAIGGVKAGGELFKEVHFRRLTAATLSARRAIEVARETLDSRKRTRAHLLPLGRRPGTRRRPDDRRQAGHRRRLHPRERRCLGLLVESA